MLLSLSTEIADAADSHGFVHGDIKPTSLFVTRRGHRRTENTPPRGSSRSMHGRNRRDPDKTLTRLEKGHDLLPNFVRSFWQFVSPR